MPYENHVLTVSKKNIIVHCLLLTVAQMTIHTIALFFCGAFIITVHTGLKFHVIILVEK